MNEEVEDLKKRLEERQSNEKHFSSIFSGYEKILTKILKEHNEVVDEKQALETHLLKMEEAFGDLRSRFERAKTTVYELTQNENILKSRLQACEEKMQQMTERYGDLLDHASDKLNKASVKLDKTDRKHIAETAKLKANILQSKVRINDLEKQISRHNIKADGDAVSYSMFEPLINPLIK